MINSNWIKRELYIKELNKSFFNYNCIFNQTKWHKVLEKGFGVDSKYLASTNENGKILCLTPIFFIKKKIFNFFGSPLSGLFTIYLGPVFLNELTIDEERKVLISLHKKLLKSNASYIEWGIDGNNHRSIESFNSLIKLKYKYIAKPTYLLNLESSEENVWLSLKSRARNMIRKSINKGVKIENIRINEDWISDFYLMLQETFKRQKLNVPHPYDFYEKLLDLDNETDIKCYSAIYNGKIVAKSIFIVDAKKLIYFSGTSNIDGMKLAANSLIQWEAIKGAIKQNLSFYDLGGIGIKSIDKFKESFNGKFIEHHRWVYKGMLFSFFYKFYEFLRNRKIINLNIHNK